MTQKSPLGQAIQQIADEKGIPVESIIETIKVALAAAYRKDFGKKNQNIVVEFDAETGQSKVFDIKTVVDKPIKERKLKEELSPSDDHRSLRGPATSGDGIPLKAGGEPSPTEALASKQEGKEGKKEKSPEGGSQPKADQPLAGATITGGEEKMEEAVTAEKTESKKETKEGAELKDEEKAKEGAEEEIEYLNEKTELTLEQAKEIKKDAKLGDVIKTKLIPPAEYGRMAAQTAKQVIIQRLREIEREALLNEYKAKEGEILNGIVQRIEGKALLVDLGQVTAVMPIQEQVPGENYSPGQRTRVYLVSVERGRKGPDLLVSRSHPNMVRKLFSLEVPEIASGVVEIKSVAREAGSRTKIAVSTTDENIDPIGSCVGQRGTRVQTVISELGGEKIDVIEWSEDPVKFITYALSPAKIVSVQLREKEKTAIAEVKEEQLSLAIGKTGQNVRLASILAGWKIDIVSEKVKKAKAEKKSAPESEKKEKLAKDEANTPKPAPTPTPKESPTEKEPPVPVGDPFGTGEKKEKAKAQESKKEELEAPVSAETLTGKREGKEGKKEKAEKTEEKQITKDKKEENIVQVKEKETKRDKE